MQHRIGDRRGSRAERGCFASAFVAARTASGRRLCALLAGALLAGCTTSVENTFTLFADPGKYEFYSCDQITAQPRRSALLRERGDEDGIDALVANGVHRCRERIRMCHLTVCIDALRAELCEHLTQPAVGFWVLTLVRIALR